MRVTLRATERGNQVLYTDRSQKHGRDEDVQDENNTNSSLGRVDDGFFLLIIRQNMCRPYMEFRSILRWI